MAIVIVDTGALVALLDKADAHHPWAVEVFRRLRPPLLTCEAVMAEAWHLLGRAPPSRSALLRLIRSGIVLVKFNFTSDASAVALLLEKYADVPMDFADACLVRMTELNPDAHVWCVDSDFHVYRRHGREVIPLIFPRAGIG